MNSGSRPSDIWRWRSENESRAGIPAELHIYATGDHFFGVRQNEKLPSRWPQLCVNWLRSFDLLKERR